MKKILVLILISIIFLTSTLAAELTSKSSLDGTYKYFYRDGKEIAKWTYFNDGRVEKKGESFTGTFKEYDKSGRILSEITYKNGIEQGPYKLYYYDRPGKVEEGSYEAGVKQGKYKIYYDAVAICEEGFYKKGLLDGTIKTYYKNSKLFSAFIMKNGIMQGKAKKFYPDGTLKEEAEFMSNKIHGIHKIYYQDGKIHLDESYKFGVLLRHKAYNEKGELIENTRYEYNKPGNGQKK